MPVRHPAYVSRPGMLVRHPAYVSRVAVDSIFQTFPVDFSLNLQTSSNTHALETLFSLNKSRIFLFNVQLKSVRVHFAYGSDGRSFFVEYS